MSKLVIFVTLLIKSAPTNVWLIITDKKIQPNSSSIPVAIRSLLPESHGVTLAVDENMIKGRKHD